MKRPLLPIDEAGRVRLVRASSAVDCIGSESLRHMVRDADGKDLGTRAAVTQAAIEAFVAIHLDPFDALKAKLL